jgi:hypothetical protein
MPMDLTPEQWLLILERMLDDRLPAMNRYEKYYDGLHDLEFATAKFKEAFGDLFSTFATNWCGLVVDAAVERLGVEGFRFGNSNADTDAWDIWQMNAMDAEAIKAHTEAVKNGISYAIVDPAAPLGATPHITVEHPSQVIVAHDRADKRKRLAALKRYRDFDGTDWAIVYLPDRIVRFQAKVLGVDDEAIRNFMGIYLPPTYLEGLAGGRWERVEEYSHILAAVPVVPIVNNAQMLKPDGVSDLKPAIALNDAANKFFSDMMVASEYAAYPQRLLTGVEVPKDPITGEEMPIDLVASLSRTWIFQPGTDAQGNQTTNPTAQQFEAADLSNYVNALDTTIQHIAAQTRTPPHYLLAKMVNLSADALKAAEAGLVFRVKRKHVDFSDSWEEVIRLAFRARGDEDRGNRTDAETIWRNPETKAPSSVADALVKMKDLMVPFDQLWEEYGYSPMQIQRMKAEAARVKREQEALAIKVAEAGGNAANNPQAQKPTTTTTPSGGNTP